MKFKKIMLPILLLSAINISIQSKWSDCIPFSWFASKQKQNLGEELFKVLKDECTKGAPSNPQDLINNIAELIKKGADVNYQNQLGMTPLYLAIALENVAIVKELLAHGANPNSKDTIIGLSPLFLSLENMNLTKLLLDNKANPNIQIATGQTPLMHAALTNNVQLAKLLLCSGADINIKDSERKVAIDYARGPNNKEVREVLEAIQ